MVESTWAASRVEPNGSPIREPPRHHPAVLTSSGTSSRPEAVVETARIGTTVPLGNRAERGRSGTTTDSARVAAGAVEAPGVFDPDETGVEGRGVLAVDSPPSVADQTTAPATRAARAVAAIVAESRGGGWARVRRCAC
ncbi:hypothetical protein NOCA270108 [metagenome]|uniref:Uncharacterized protein n=1 Tax=metagenome TaxID=256318 RepID=A0A2P2CDX9_9ZZZZ